MRFTQYCIRQSKLTGLRSKIDKSRTIVDVKNFNKKHMDQTEKTNKNIEYLNYLTVSILSLALSLLLPFSQNIYLGEYQTLGLLIIEWNSITCSQAFSSREGPPDSENVEWDLRKINPHNTRIKTKSTCRIPWKYRQDENVMTCKQNKKINMKETLKQPESRTHEN